MQAGKFLNTYWNSNPVTYLLNENAVTKRNRAKNPGMTDRNVKIGPEIRKEDLKNIDVDLSPDISGGVHSKSFEESLDLILKDAFLDE